MSKRPEAITAILEAHLSGDAAATRRLYEIVYDDLKGLARMQRRHGRGAATLNTTALVHEAYLKLGGSVRLSARDRGHFLAIAARAMRQILVDHARRRHTGKHGAGVQRVTLDERSMAVDEQAGELLALEDALAGLAELDERLVAVVECRYFGGLSEQETADALDSSVRTIQRDWQRARAWLRVELDREPDPRKPA